ncbi:MAG: histidine phosphatase family protein [Spirochaetales bacterium]|nr:histidine phosphatase family protein [Leptospiraceae bacterium]MCP5482815.1 histidine phosphatase family protein [Spirochaetales bacterium]
MKLLFVRHAIALDREMHEGDDLTRPLTARGRKRARKAFRGLARLFDNIDLIVSSEATRARETADILGKVFPKATRETEALLNPGAGYADLSALLSTMGSHGKTIALVGHEPDFSEMISGLVQGGTRTPDMSFQDLHLAVKKSGLVEVNLFKGPTATGQLCNLLSPRVLRLLGE